jgi:hypothetical protein
VGDTITCHSKVSRKVERGGLHQYTSKWTTAKEVLDEPVKNAINWLHKIIDDRAICFRGTFPTDDEMLNFKCWNREKYEQ